MGEGRGWDCKVSAPRVFAGPSVRSAELGFGRAAGCEWIGGCNYKGLEEGGVRGTRVSSIDGGARRVGEVPGSEHGGGRGGRGGASALQCEFGEDGEGVEGEGGGQRRGGDDEPRAVSTVGREENTREAFGLRRARRFES